tara:strand:- start:1819 stop:2181 length:363 start_codon:yes stop_codon:yes gene_type:complete
MAAQENKQYNFELSYTPYDFYYSTNREDLPKEQICAYLEKEKQDGNLFCGRDSTAEDCYKYELCHNKHLVNKMYEQRNEHLTSEERYDDMYKKYQFAILKTINLTAGIVGSLVFIYYYNK